MTESFPLEGLCPTCFVAAGRSPGYIVYQTEYFVAFLDPAPIRPGHLRIVPRAHFPDFNALPAGVAAGLLELGQRLGEVQRTVLQVGRVGYLFPAGDDVDRHAGVHLVPLLSAGDVVARRPLAQGRPVGVARPAAPAAELAAMAALLRDGLVGARAA
ncbi:MAG: HIT family protein [Kiloniellaceae bacterium]